MFIKCKNGETSYFFNADYIRQISCQDSRIVMVVENAGILYADVVLINNYTFTVRNIDDLMRNLNL